MTGMRGPRTSMMRPMTGPAASSISSRNESAHPNVEALQPRSREMGSMKRAKFTPSPTPTAPNRLSTPAMIHP